MAIQAHGCNQQGCSGFIRFDNADFNYQDAIKNNRYVLDNPKCDTCGKEFKVVVSHSLIEVDENDDFVEEIRQVCYTEYERSIQKNRSIGRGGND